MIDTNHSTRRPKVSVLMITYNHEKFIEQAVRSVMMQETDFDYELIIGEDCSTDSTREIVLRLKEEFPDKIRLILNERNLGVAPNFRRTYVMCQGEYVAFLEGDDYWTSKKKLQMQAGLLDAREDVSLCFHPVQVWSEFEREFTGFRSTGIPGVIYNFIDLINLKIFPHTASVMIRRNSLEIPSTIDELLHIDYILYCICTERGKLSFIDKPMAVYRQHGGGVSSGKDVITRKINSIKSYIYLNERYKYRYSSQIRLRRHVLALSREYSYQGKMQEARRTALRAVFNRYYGNYLNMRDYARTFLLAFAPGASHIQNIVRACKHSR